MDAEFEALELLKGNNHIVFTLPEGINHRTISNRRLLEIQEMVVWSWSTNLESLINGRLTRKGMDLRNYLKQYEWE